MSRRVPRPCRGGTSCRWVSCGGRAGPDGDDDDEHECSGYRRWLDENHFTFIGYQEYEVTRDAAGEESLRAVAGSALGLLREKYPLYRDMQLEVRPLIQMTIKLRTHWSAK